MSKNKYKITELEEILRMKQMNNKSDKKMNKTEWK